MSRTTTFSGFILAGLFVSISSILLLGGCEKPEQEEELLPLLHQRYGLGKVLIAERSNNVSYEWYIAQWTTGEYKEMNCGPTCATMACKWANPNFSKTVEEARNDYLTISPSGWPWATMLRYLTDNKIYHDSGFLYDENSVKTAIDNGHICILALDMYYIRKVELTNTKGVEWRIDRFYDASISSGHYIIVKGYKIVDDITWFEVYDSAGGWICYKDGTPCGRDRYYRSTEVINAAYHWAAEYAVGLLIVKQGEK
jgi:hypothetical protein